MNVTVNIPWYDAWDTIFRLIPFLIPLVLILVTLQVVALVNVIRKPLPWRDKGLWLLLILGVNTIGPIVYLLVGVPHLDAKLAAEEDEDAL